MDSSPTIEPAAEAAFAIDLSHDELAWLLATLRMPPIIGMGKALYPEGTSEDVASARLQAGGLALQARRLVTLTDESFQIETMIAGILGAYALADHVLLVAQQDRAGQSIAHFVYYLSSRLMVEYGIPAPGIHRFVVMVNRDMIVDRIMNNLAWQQDVAWNAPAHEIEWQALQDVLDAVQHDDLDGGFQYLIGQGWPEPDAEQFIEVLAAHQTLSYITTLHADEAGDGRQIDAASKMTVLEAEQGLLASIEQSGDDPPGRLAFNPVTGDQIRDWLTDELAGLGY